MICPVTGKPCTLPKSVVINEVIDGHAKVIRLCHQCAPAYLNSEKMSVPPQLPVLHPHNPQHPSHPAPNPGQATPGQLLAEMLAYFQNQGKQPTIVVQQSQPQVEDKCPACGTTFEQIHTSGRMGCPFCYTHFKEQMDLACQGIHGSTKHCGKVPKPKLLLEKITADETPQEPPARTVHPSKLDEHLLLLEQKLGEAVRTEQFEECIRLRDVIRALKNIKAEKVSVMALLQVAAEAEDTDEVQRLSARIAALSKQFASLIMAE